MYQNSKGFELISVTDLTSFMFCPRLLYQQKVLGYVEKPNAAMTLGSIRHNFHDVANKKEQELVVGLSCPESETETKAAYESVYLKIISDLISGYSDALSGFDLEPNAVLQKMAMMAVSEAHERASNVSRYATKTGMSGANLWENLSPRIISELRVRSKLLRLKGVVDRVEIHEGHITPIELKTGKLAREGVWPSHRVQAAAYMMLLQENYSCPVERAIVRYLDHQIDMDVSLNPFMELEVKELTKKVIWTLNSTAVPAPCSKEGCSCRLIK
jgi:CRISPR/Cas system-associated exonuclease Cas4 (RecB family)